MILTLQSLPLLFFLTISFSFADEFGNIQEGEGGELVVTEGIVIREISSLAAEPLPLLAIGTAQKHHYLYNPNLLAMQGVWHGRFGLDRKDGFSIARDSVQSFSLDEIPWSFGDRRDRRAIVPHWDGTSVKDGTVYFNYRLEDTRSDLSWKISEWMEYESELVQHLHFKIEPSAESDEYLNYWLRQTDFRKLATNGQQNQRNKIKNLFPNQTEFTVSFYRRSEAPAIPQGYTISSVDLPSPEAPFLFEPTAMDFAPDGTLYTSHRTGGVWRLKDGRWDLFAEGLHEANGIQVAPDDSGIYVMQKPELTFLTDTDGDGIADLYQSVESRFRFSGNYHEFAYGPMMSDKGDLFFSTGLSSNSGNKVPSTNPNQMGSYLGYRGWVMKKTRNGELLPFASGLRSPAGIGMNEKNELFVTDNQGDWVASSYLAHVEEGDFLGHPASRYDLPELNLTESPLDYRSSSSKASVKGKQLPELLKEDFSQKRKPPAVWLSHGDLTNSPGHPSFAPRDKFGPFGGQAFIADIAHRNVIRVALEKVNGIYQGAAFPFIRPLSSSSYSTRFDPQGRLWVGSVGRGWTGGESALEIISYDGRTTPFEIHHIALTKKGFDLVFTDALSKKQVTSRHFEIREYRYQYWDTYGSEPIRESFPKVSSVTTSPDRKTVSIDLPHKKGFIYEIQLKDFESASGAPLINDYGVYTLNQLLP